RTVLLSLPRNRRVSDLSGPCETSNLLNSAAFTGGFVLCRRLALAVLVASIAASFAAVAVNGQTRTGSGAMVPKGWTPPRAGGHPDLSGVWTHNAATPMERPKELEGRAELTDAEPAALQRTAAQLFDGNGDAAFGDAIYIAALNNVLGKEKGFTSRDA